MLDKLAGPYASRKYSTLHPDYAPQKVITGRSLTNESADHLTVLFPSWRGGDIFYKALAQRLLSRGSAVLQYKFDHQLLEPDAERVIDSFMYIQQSVSDELKQLELRHQYSTIHLVAASLGNVAMSLVAQKYSGFDAATFVVPASNLAKSLWEGDRTQWLREEFEKQGLTEQQLERAWAELAPAESAAWFKGVDTTVLISQTDTIIPHRYQAEMIDALESNGANPRVTLYNTGHLATIARYCLGY